MVLNGCRIHVANVIHYLHQGGGVAVQALNMATYIESLGVSTSFSTLRPPTRDRSTNRLIESYPGRVNISRRAGVLLDPLVLARNLKASFQENYYNVIQAYDPLVTGSACYLVKQNQKEIPLVIRLGTTYLTHFAFQFYLSRKESIRSSFESAVKSKLLLPLLSIIERTTLQSADAVVANCEYLRGIYKNIYPKLKNIVVVRNGVDTSIFTPNGPKVDLTNGKLTILYVGRIEERKGLDDLLRAMVKVFKNHPQSRLLLVGRAPDKSYQTHLERLTISLSISSKIKFVGAMDNQSLPRLMRSADVLVFPSSTHGEEIEGLPNSVLEGLATGLPVVANRICGIPEVINHGRNGLLVKPGSIDEFSSSIINLLDSEPMRCELGGNARNQTIKFNSMDNMAKKYLRLYSHIVTRAN